MSSGWSWWIIILIVFNLGSTFLLFLWAPRAKVPVLPDGTTGHSWAHGVLREGMHRLPRWWIVLSLAMYLIAFGYFILYPGFGDREGTLGWTSTMELDAATTANNAKLEPVMQRLAAMRIESVAADPQAQRLGERLFVDNCAACHGRNGLGNARLGAPNLADGDWLYGDADEDIATSIRDGRMGVMPPWEMLGEETVKNLTQYVLHLSGRPHDAAAATAGQPAFEMSCSACHAPDGTGNPLLGAPNLTDDSWLYGGSREAIEQSIHSGRNGQMPGWSSRLSDAEIHILTGYVRHLSQRGNAAAQ
ncbi:MAG: cytochrome-c oxidase, cbb3-type subunit III [Steroidobacteraceae bacterium]|nr:cytochrome-c oxidase, cbb3-type subunit III [Nevskiaceae bacterium]MCP5360263.1 cytochrome-c oxidase, cbb3-type subunit III [Nevskiaceae bacterium]MCP5466600.1 cytochrome-c oxidase, cbb3-type subunit III [Nevskiaceae bacterium]